MSWGLRVGVFSFMFFASLPPPPSSPLSWDQSRKRKMAEQKKTCEEKWEAKRTKKIKRKENQEEWKSGKNKCKFAKNKNKSNWNVKRKNFPWTTLNHEPPFPSPPLPWTAPPSLVTEQPWRRLSWNKPELFSGSYHKKTCREKHNSHKINLSSRKCFFSSGLGRNQKPETPPGLLWPSPKLKRVVHHRIDKQAMTIKPFTW